MGVYFLGYLLSPVACTQRRRAPKQSHFTPEVVSLVLLGFLPLLRAFVSTDLSPSCNLRSTCAPLVHPSHGSPCCLQVSTQAAACRSRVLSWSGHNLSCAYAGAVLPAVAGFWYADLCIPSYPLRLCALLPGHDHCAQWACLQAHCNYAQLHLAIPVMPSLKALYHRWIHPADDMHVWLQAAYYPMVARLAAGHYYMDSWVRACTQP